MAGEFHHSNDDLQLSLCLSRNGLAIYLDENLHYGQTERCDTFDNDPLCSVRDFTINSIEVFGFVDISW